MENAVISENLQLKDLTSQEYMEYYQKARVELEGKDPPEGFVFTR
mgnify:CR=1 FL=1